MTPAPTPANTADQQPNTIKARQAVDLLRILNELRFGRHGRLPAALRDDLDYHAGLLQVRIHRASRPHTTNHITEHPHR